MKCRLQSLHNSLPWGLGIMSSDHIVDEAHIVIESLLNCSSEIYAKVDMFLSRRVVFVDRQDRHEDVRAFWSLLDVRETMMPLFLELNPWWNGSHLEVSKECENDIEVMEKLSSVLLYGFRWLKWSRSRWCRAGRAGRFFLRSLALGISPLVQEVFDDPAVSNYLLTGFRRCTMEIKRSRCCSMCCKTTDCFANQNSYMLTCRVTWKQLQPHLSSPGSGLPPWSVLRPSTSETGSSCALQAQRDSSTGRCSRIFSMVSYPSHKGLSNRISSTSLRARTKSPTMLSNGSSFSCRQENRKHTWWTCCGC